jgi:hypothetical protein
MKFIIIHGPLGEIDVRLASETKQKLRTIAYYATYATAIGAGAAVFIHKARQDETRPGFNKSNTDT